MGVTRAGVLRNWMGAKRTSKSWPIIKPKASKVRHKTQQTCQPDPLLVPIPGCGEKEPIKLGGGGDGNRPDTEKKPTGPVQNDYCRESLREDKPQDR